MSFNPGADGTVWSLAIQPDGRILVGGSFRTLENQPHRGIGRMDANGIVEASFLPWLNIGGIVYSMAVQADGKIILGGSFTNLCGQARTNIGRLNPDGTLDSDFDPGANNIVLCVWLQADGEILVGGTFTTLDGQPRSHFGRLHTNGRVDTEFYPATDNAVYAAASQPDGRILVGGNFRSLDGQTHWGLGRLYNTTPVVESLNYNAGRITWVRWGATPEVWRTSFEHSSDGGGTWTMLSRGTRIAGGWELSGISLPKGILRARGFVTGGAYNGSGGIVGTNINVDADAPPQLRIERVAGQPNQRRLTFGPCQAERTYTPEFTTNLSNAPSWAPLQSAVTTTNGTERTVVDLGATDASRWYRIRVSVP